VGIWLCRGQTQTTPPSSSFQGKAKGKKKASLDPEADLSDSDRLWLDLLYTIVNVSKHVTASSQGLLSAVSDPSALDVPKITSTLRTAVQEGFTALLASTTDQARQLSAQQFIPRTRPTSYPAFLRILRAFLTRAARSSPSLSELRAVLADIFAAYTFEETVLTLSNQFLDKDLFLHVDEAHRRRLMGWRPRGQVCEGCSRRVWGPGAGNEIWEAWERRRQREERLRRAKAEARRLESGSRLLEGGRGKGKAAGGPATALPSVPVASGTGMGVTASGSAGAAVSIPGSVGAGKGVVGVDDDDDDGDGEGEEGGVGGVGSSSAAARDERGAIGAEQQHTHQQQQEPQQQQQQQPQQSAVGVVGSGANQAGLGPLVVFACRHMWHRRCLEGASDEGTETGELRCPLESH